MLRCRVLILGFAAVAASPGATAATYAIMPLIGHEFTNMTSRAPSYQRARIDAPFFDNVMLSQIDDALRKARPHASTVLLRVDPAQVHADDLAASVQPALSAVLDRVLPQVLAAGADRLIVVAPYRHAIDLTLVNSRAEGGAEASGIGVYLEPFEEVIVKETGDKVRGFVGVFANFRLLLIDCRSRALLGEVDAAAGAGFANARGADAAAALTAPQRLSALAQLLQRQLARSVPDLLAQSRE
ncbi:MAG TPA: hypothetical protein VGV08_08960 [Casimicrobiaceae bacterium]|nr:hypothetical protein [Casimicrobiaceae bacterium]